MLTEDQLIQLKFLTKHKKYGKLLTDAIEIWKQEKVKPTKKCFGVFYNSDKSELTLDGSNKCCLLGAALVGKNISRFDSKIDTILKYFDISRDEFYNIMFGFDHVNSSEETEDFAFANLVREIVLC